MENLFKDTFLLDEKTDWKEYLKNQRKSLPIALIRVLNRLLYKKWFLGKKQYFFFWTGKCFSISREDELLEKISETMEENGFYLLEIELPLAGIRSALLKWVSFRRNKVCL